MISLIGSILFLCLAICFIIHTFYTRRLGLLSRYRSQCQKTLRLYNLELRSSLDLRHLSALSTSNTTNSSSTSLNGSIYMEATNKMAPRGPFLSLKRRIAGKVYDLLDAYRFENWKRKYKTKTKSKSD